MQNHSAASDAEQTSKMNTLPQASSPKPQASFWCSLRLIPSPFISALVRRSFNEGGFPLFVLLLFLGAMFWAKREDPFSRRWFTLKTTETGSFHGVAVLPKPLRRVPVVVYAHGSGGSLMTDGNDLRQMAEMGLATVSLDYDETNAATFNAQWTALLQYLGRQPWADTNAMAWVGFSLGAERTLAFAQSSSGVPPLRPQFLVQISGAGLPPAPRPPTPDARPQTPDPQFHCPVLLIHGDQDEIFPVADTRRLADCWQSNGVPVTLQILAGLSHNLDPERGMVFRRVGEACLTHLAGPEVWRQYHSIAQWQAEAPGLGWFWLPALAWGLGCLHWRRCQRRALAPAPGSPPADAARSAELPATIAPETLGRKWGRLGGAALPWVAAILAVAAAADTALHLAPPHFPVSPRTLDLARRFLVQPKERADFEALAGQPVWSGEPLRVLLDHVELAVYNRELINWTLSDDLYRGYVLTPVIAGRGERGGEALDWRRPLWEEFYPRIRHESSPAEAARIVARHLHERVTVAVLPEAPHTVPDIWRRQITDTNGFEILSVAALRSVGVPARLNDRGRAQFWDGDHWTD
jgi:dienelactone hydrolase